MVFARGKPPRPNAGNDLGIVEKSEKAVMFRDRAILLMWLLVGLAHMKMRR